jgi:undecaprenyl-diphosphatase
MELLARRLPWRRAVVLVLALTAQLAVLTAVASLVGLIVRDLLDRSAAHGLDATVLRWVVRHREPWLTSFMKVVTAFGGSAVLLPLVAVVGVVLWRRRGSWAPLGLLVAAYGGAFVAYHVVKVVVGRPRPGLGFRLVDASGYGFPSGHATQSAAVYGALVVVCAASSPSARRALWSALATVAVVLIGASRVYLGVHWTTDVVGGWVLGGIWLWIVVATTRRLPPAGDYPTAAIDTMGSAGGWSPSEPR